MDTLNFILKKFNLEDKWYNSLSGVGNPLQMPLELENFGRNQLALLFRELGFKVGVEVGVESGVYSEILLESNPDLYLFSVDAWKAHRAYRDHTRQEKFDKFYEDTVKKLFAFGNRSHIIRKYSMDAVKDFEDRSLDFVYIDANHKFVEFANDLHHWSKKVKVGGIVAGHDYTKYKDLDVELHIPYVLQGYTDAYKIKPWFTIGRNVDNVRSWFYIQTQK